MKSEATPEFYATVRGGPDDNLEFFIHFLHPKGNEAVQGLEFPGWPQGTRTMLLNQGRDEEAIQVGRVRFQVPDAPFDVESALRSTFAILDHAGSLLSWGWSEFGGGDGDVLFSGCWSHRANYAVCIPGEEAQLCLQGFEQRQEFHWRTTCVSAIMNAVARCPEIRRMM